MPLNKFNQHFLTSNPSCSEEVVGAPSQSVPFYICQPTEYYSTCIIYIRGSFIGKKNNIHYILENGTSTYEIPVTGKVVRVQCDPNILYVNYKNQSTKIEDLINGNILNKGDIMEFKFNHNQPSLSLYLEMVLQCPLEH